jgi:hypothetical protein
MANYLIFLIFVFLKIQKTEKKLKSKYNERQKATDSYN